MKFSPMAGCWILIVVACVFIGVIGFSAWMFGRVQFAITSFTQPEPVELVVESLDGKQAELTALTSQLNDFKSKIEAKQASQLEISAAQMNIAIASYPLLEGNRGMLQVEKIADGFIQARVSYPMKSADSFSEMLGQSLRGEEGNLRYLNGTLFIVPELMDGGPFPRVDKIASDTETEVTNQFREMIAQTLLYGWNENPQLQPVFDNVTEVKIADDKLVLSYQPDAPRQLAVDNSENGVMGVIVKVVGIICVLFLAFAAFVIVLMRRHRKRLAASQE
ncbi:hypothetical protein [Persicirhabdus sediminis]|uniref:Uncharacterized protein n=1 Tax=Persicirhabdus sediminis TaxID=454144 RepID=A0A8J7MC69_9BACT|nr:hypothetical protein [Persicirhabdus sediminis]MBK1790437.1 hypothetical protein [Persicirhabdus sediminis]